MGLIYHIYRAIFLSLLEPGIVSLCPQNLEMSVAKLSQISSMRIFGQLGHFYAAFKPARQRILSYIHSRPGRSWAFLMSFCKSPFALDSGACIVGVLLPKLLLLVWQLETDSCVTSYETNKQNHKWKTAEDGCAQYRLCSQSALCASFLRFSFVTLYRGEIPETSFITDCALEGDSVTKNP